jgi:hypothetical protein
VAEDLELRSRRATTAATSWWRVASRIVFPVRAIEAEERLGGAVGEADPAPASTTIRPSTIRSKRAAVRWRLLAQLGVAPRALLGDLAPGDLAPRPS